MATRIQAPVVRRTSLPLTEQNERDLSKIRKSSSYQRALEVLSGRKIVDADVSTSALLHAIFEAGMAVVQKEAEITGYAEIASTQSVSEVKRHRGQSRRRRPSWADEL